jgi:uncharacterized glyoxalase superfamily protein PhnB
MNESTTSTANASAHVWITARARDADAFLRFMVDVVGFTESVVYRDEDQVHHAELLWPLGGGLMFGSASEEADLPLALRPGSSSAYVVCEDPDALHARVVAAGATVLLEPYDTPYGSREFAFADPEGNRWAFGTYGGAPRS